MNEKTNPINNAPEIQSQSGWLSPDAAEEIRTELIHSYMDWQKVRSQAWGLCDAIRNDMVPTVVYTLADMLLRELEQREPDPLIVEISKNWEGVDAKAKSDGLDAARAEIDTLRKQLANAQRELSEQGLSHSVELQQETADLRQQQLDDAQAEIEKLRQQLDAARTEAVTLRTRNDALLEKNKRLRYDHARLGHLVEERGQEMERLLAFVAKARETISPTMTYCDVEFLSSALAELDAGTAEPAPVAEPAPCPELERLREFAGIVQDCLFECRTAAQMATRVSEAFAVLHEEPTHRIFTTEPTPVTEPLDAEGGA